MADTWYTPIPSSEAIKAIRKHKGKAFVTISGTEFMVAIEKADLIASMLTDVMHGDCAKWLVGARSWGLHIEAHRD